MASPNSNPSNFSHVKSSPPDDQTAISPSANLGGEKSDGSHTNENSKDFLEKSSHRELTSTVATESGISDSISCKSIIFRILDANLDRAREGVRVIEDWCRFGINDETSMAQLKHLRQSIARWHTPEIRLARDTPGDFGTALTHPQEATRSSLVEVLQVNFARCQEALRVLEEYSKLHSTEMAADCKQMRYQLYTLDSQIVSPLLKLSIEALATFPPEPPISSAMSSSTPYPSLHEQLMQARTYLVTSPVPDLLTVVESALKGGIAIVQYREKQADDDERLRIAQQMKTLCHQYGALFIVNDRVDIAAAADADGVHLGQHDLPMEAARKILGSEKIVGRSTTNPTELKRALNEGADYIGVGPVHETPTKPGKAASGNDYVRYAAQHATMPWFTIGGLNAENLAPTLEAGATRVAVVRALMQANDPEAVARSLVQQTQQAPRPTP